MIEQQERDLTRLKFWDDNTLTKQTDNSRPVNPTKVHVYFRNQKIQLLELIQAHDWVVGCVAWLTDFDILRALSKKHVAIVVQKEDFLRPEKSGHPIQWKDALRRAYTQIPKFSRYSLPRLCALNCCADPTSQAIRCMGNYNRDADPAFPRMHNKFLVFGGGHKTESFDNQPYCEEDFPTFTSVWTGSCNLSKTSGQSLENAVLLEGKDVADAYYNEFAQIFTLSEPLNWEYVWCAPEYRIGT